MPSEMLSVQSTQQDLETRDLCESALVKLFNYCQETDWAGYEPYDVLNSKLISVLPFMNFRAPRIAITQLLKRSPVNLRRLLRIEKTQNPKALAIFLSAFVKLSSIRLVDVEALIPLMVERLIALRSDDVPYWSWGYSFPWQTRKVLVPRGFPNLVCTTFVANALLDVHEKFHDERCLEMASSAAEYLMKELYWTGNGSVAGFSYPLPSVRPQVYNANFLASALMCRVYKHTGEERWLGPALKAARYSASKQRADGSWVYGEYPTQQWIDNFHTGFNLSSLRSIGRYAGTSEFEPHLQRGLDFYRKNFFCESGAVRYFHDRTYPIDTHCVAQSMITLLDLEDLDPAGVPLANSVFRWAMNHLWDDRGYFYFRILRLCTNRISYIRWSQAWMFLAMSTLLCRPNEADRQCQIDRATTPVGA